MSSTYDIKFSESDFEILTELENDKYYQEVFIDFCKSRLPGWEDKNNTIYYQSLIAAKYFAQSMLSDNDLENAYEVGLSIMFNTDLLN